MRQFAIYLEALLDALSQFPEVKLIFTKSNADANGRKINAKIDQFVLENNNAI